MRCRICHSEELIKFLDLGFTPPADDFLSVDRLNEPETWYPLDVYICNVCSLVQLGHVVPPDILFQKDYPYESSTTSTGVQHFHSFAETVFLRFGLQLNDLVIDIGSNVGVLLEGFKKMGADVLGVDPAPNICDIAISRGINTINNFFDYDLAVDILKSNKKAKIITGTNVVAHIDDIHSLVRAIDLLLDEKGVFIFEAPYLVDLIDNLEYDTIYHEHLSYLSIKPMDILFHKYGMEIFDVEKVNIHGGSLRYFVAREKTYPISDNVTEFLKLEENKKIYHIETLKTFAESVYNHREKLNWLLNSIKHDGKRIVGVSAPAKGMTLLNYCRIGPDILDFVTEKSKLKIGKYTPGMHIKILPDSELNKNMPDYTLLLAWNFADEIMRNLNEYTKNGGKFIIPIPEPKIIE